MKFNIYQFTFFIVLILFNNCSTIKLNLNLVNNIIDEDKYPVPVKVRIFQIKDSDQFNTAKVRVLFRNGQETLKENLLSTKSLQIFSGKKELVKIKKEKGSKSVGIIAILKKPDNNLVWKRIYNIDDEELKEKINIKLTGDKSNEITLNFIPTEMMNYVKGKSYPTSLYIYQLSSNDKFKKSNFKELWKNSETLLRKDIVGIEKVNVYPGKITSHVLKKSDQAKYLGIFGIFKSPGNDNSWKSVLDIDNNYFDEISITVENNKINLFTIAGGSILNEY